ncbi:HEPN domain-containing protein [Tissierella sp. Yu-01]|uniref:HEPN domain-containing protein n=1 Tax=Tissierella sp. Yu-01 TaxID=3035694 RepID=UPI00240E32CA|nr:HEPN domain-containing protein [Tissierella sp. Yu-01]WFA10459.1 HEPN domain-containing protein [Tissierella sp. Yu-01]
MDTTRYLDWLEMAKKDLRGAEILFEYKADYGLVCFHCQQTIEKYLKGYLLYKTGVLQEGHSLIKLCKKAAEFNIEFKRYIKDCAFVSTYYIETRYPAEDPLIITEDEVKMCLDITMSIIKLIDITIDNKK